MSVGAANVELLASVAFDLVDGVSAKANCLCATEQLVRLHSGSFLLVDKAFLSVKTLKVILWVIRASMFSFLKILVIFLSNLSEINRISN